MHSILSITDGIYGAFSDNDVGERIAKLKENKPDSTEAIIQQLELIIEMLKK